MWCFPQQTARHACLLQCFSLVQFTWQLQIRVPACAKKTKKKNSQHMYETRSGVTRKVKDLFPSWSPMCRKSTHTGTRWKQVGSRVQLIQQLITAERETDKVRIQLFCLKATNSLKQTHEMLSGGFSLTFFYQRVCALRNGLHLHKINCIRLSEEINLWIVKRKHLPARVQRHPEWEALGLAWEVFAGMNGRFGSKASTFLNFH